MTTEYSSDAEETSFDYNDEEIEIVLKSTPVLTFASGPAPGFQVDNNNNSCELQKTFNLEKIAQSGHNCKQTNTFNSDGENETANKTEKHEVRSHKGKALAKKTKLEGVSESNGVPGTLVSPEESPRSRRSHKIALIRSLSSSAAAPEELPPRTRRLSDPIFPSQKSLVKGAFDRQTNLRKLRPYLKRKAVSPLHLLGKVASSPGSKHNHDAGPFKDTKGDNKGRLVKRMSPSFSKAYEQLAHTERRGSDPSGIPSADVNTVNDYGTMINDFSSQIQDLAVNLENLSTTDTANREFQENLGGHKPYRQQCGEQEARDDSSTENLFKEHLHLHEDDIHLQEMLEEVLRSHLLSMEDYSPPSCDRGSRSICKIITRLLSGAVKRTGDGPRKLACLVYIGAVRDNGIQMAAQALWCPEEDTFAAASFRNESVYGLAVVIATPTS